MNRALPFLLALLWLLGCGESAWRPRVVVLVSVDTLRADHLGAYGYPRPTSTFIDWLAENGVTFERSFAVMPTTAPSHASMLTGLYPLQHGVRRNGERLPDDARLLPAMLAAAGWDTAGFVSTNAHFAASGLDAGFAHFDEPRPGTKERPARGTVAIAADWLRGRVSQAPLLLFVHFFDPHSPYQPRKPLVEPPRQRGALASYLLNEHHLDPDFFAGNESLMLDLVFAYDGEIRMVDRALRELYAAVEESVGLTDSLWILTADHGEGLGNHGWLLHGKKVYNEQLRVPLVFHAPGRLAPARVGAVVDHVDLLPTLLELAGVDGSGLALPGRSLVPLLEGREDGGGEERFALAERRSFDAPETPRTPPRPLPPRPTVHDLVEAAIHDNFEPGEAWAIQDRRYKLIVDTTRGDQLFDLSEDPYETTDLAAERPEIAKRLRARLEARREALRAGALRGPVTPVDEASRRALEALGYIDP